MRPGAATTAALVLALGSLLAYWKNRWVSYLVTFDGDKVARVQE